MCFGLRLRSLKYHQKMKNCEKKTNAEIPAIRTIDDTKINFKDDLLMAGAPQPSGTALS